MFLYRDIKGRRENLSPLFVVGGVFTRKNPFFSNAISLNDGKINTDSIKSIISMMGEDAKFVKTGLIKGIFANEDKIQSQLDASSVGEAFESIIADMKKTYE